MCKGGPLPREVSAFANYHYRHEYFTFSNRQYYDNELLTFPSPETAHGGVRFHHLPEARYDKGKSRTNLGEARALVHELVSRLLAENGPRRSYGVVTFSQAQQQLVENLLDEERRKNPEIENHFGDEPPVEGESVFIKNLENVQGDERDVILLSICYGMYEAGKLSMNFGPLNRDGGGTIDWNNSLQSPYYIYCEITPVAACLNGRSAMSL